MPNKKDYIFVPGGLNLDWAKLLQQYPDGENKCYLVALDDRQISVLQDLSGLMKWAWFWGIDYNHDQATWQIVANFKNEVEEALMSGCDVGLLIEAVNGVAGAITDLTGAIGGTPEGDPPVTVVSSIADIVTAIEGIPATDMSGVVTAIEGIPATDMSGVVTAIEGIPATDMSGVVTAIGGIPATDMSGVVTSLGDVNTSLAPLSGLSYLSNLTYLEQLEFLARLDNIAAVMAQCCDKTTVPDDLYIPIIFKDEETMLNSRCRVANLLWQDLRNISDDMNTGGIFEIAESEGALAAAGALGAIIEKFPMLKPFGLAVMIIVALLPFIPSAALFSAFVTKMDNAKEDFIRALYNAETVSEARALALAALGALTAMESVWVSYMFRESDCEKLSLPGDYPMPDDPVLCVSQGGGIPDACAGETNAYFGSGAPTWCNEDNSIIMDTWHEFVFPGSGTANNYFEFDGLYHVQVRVSSDGGGSINKYISYVPGDGDCTLHTLIYPYEFDTTYICDCTELRFGNYTLAQTFSIRFATEAG